MSSSHYWKLPFRGRSLIRTTTRRTCPWKPANSREPKLRQGPPERANLGLEDRLASKFAIRQSGSALSRFWRCRDYGPAATGGLGPQASR